jgi:hypothetical protein
MADVGFIEALNSINQTKKNIIRDSSSPKVAEKLYTPFQVARSLSYHPDCILFVNELNERGVKPYNITNLMHYEFLLYTVTPKKRFAKWVKPEKEEIDEYIMDFFNININQALTYKQLLSDEDKTELVKAYKSRYQTHKGKTK